LILLAVSSLADFLFPVKLLKTKTKRFVDVVEAAGKPEVYTLWQSPRKIDICNPKSKTIA